MKFKTKCASAGTAKCLQNSHVNGKDFTIS